MEDLSMIQRRVLVFIKSFMNNYGYPPTVREIASGTDIGSTSTVHSALNALEGKGYIYRDMGQSRSIVLAGTKTENGIYSIPLLESGNSKVGFVDIPKSLIVDREGVFAVKCQDDIEEKNILAGDIIVAKSLGADVKINDGEIAIYEDHSVGVFWDDYKSYGFEDGYEDSLAELYALDAFGDMEAETELKEKSIIGKAIVCIRCL